MTNVREFAKKFNAEHEIQGVVEVYGEKVKGIWDIPCKFSNYLKSSAGYASGFNGITLHNNLLGMKEGVKPTFLHEVAHMFQWLVYSEMDHRGTFVDFMCLTGQEPLRCHSMPLRQVSKAKIKLDDIEF